MSIADYLLELRQRGIELSYTGGSLRFDAPSGAMTADIRTAIAERREEIVGFLRRSQRLLPETTFIPMKDGVGLAVDLFFPPGLTDTTLPVVWCHERYRRSEMDGNRLTTKLDAQPWLRQVIEAGYVVAVVDARGTGASEGSRPAELGPAEQSDSWTVTEWLAAQEWSTGAVGMFGDSYRGLTQLVCAASAPPSLRAIFPQMPLFDLYDFLYNGGIFRDDFARRWSAETAKLDVDHGVAPVGGDQVALDAALTAHRDNTEMFDIVSRVPLRDGIDERGVRPWVDHSPSSLLDAVNASGVAVYLLGGWYDSFARDVVLWFANLDGPHKLVVGGWSHDGRAGFDLGAEHVRWYDRWLKGHEDPSVDEPPVRYFTMSAPAGSEWRHATSWPPPATSAPLFLGPGPSGTVASCNDGRLVERSDDGATDNGVSSESRLVVDYTASSGRTSRWAHVYGASFHYDLERNDIRSLTFTGDRLTSDLEITGHPVAYLWVSSSGDDVDVFAYLEEVDEIGRPHYITEGNLRASHRATGPAPYDKLGLPHHPSDAASLLAIERDPMELWFDFQPTSNVVRAGRRVRLTIAGCDRDNAETVITTSPPELVVHHGPNFPSRVVLPVVATEGNGR